MKLSEIRGERSLEVIADIIDPIANIAQDKELMAHLVPEAAKGQKAGRDALAQHMRLAVPMLLKGHKEDVVSIMATLKGVSREDYVGQMTLASVVGDVYELLTDEDFLVFLPSSEKTEE